MKKLIAVVGPTSSGKSDLAVELALKFDGEVVSADSRQIYKGLDLASGKITQEEMKGVPHHLLDVALLDQNFSVADFQKLALEKIEDIWSRGKLPILAGGTAFYVYSVTDGLVLPQVPPNSRLRKKLEKLSLEELQNKLKKLDPERLEEIDENNPVRLIRAIEIAETLGKVPKLQKANRGFDVLKIGIEIEKEKLKKRINDRLHARIDNGMIAEIENLQKEQNIPWERFEELGLESRYISRYLKNEMSKEEMLKELETKITQFAKRQMTWFKRDKEIKWFKPSQKLEILETTEGYLK